jgi:hypothetical protein
MSAHSHLYYLGNSPEGTPSHEAGHKVQFAGMDWDNCCLIAPSPFWKGESVGIILQTTGYPLKWVLPKVPVEKNPGIPASQTCKSEVI